MSWHYSQELGAEFSVDSYLDGLRSERLKSKNIHGKFYSIDKKTDIWIDSQYGTILQRLTVDHGKGPLISFPGGSLVKTFQQQEKAKGLMENDQDSGEKCRGWFAKYLPDLSLWKTPQCSLLEDCIEYSETWPKWGTMLDGACWELMTPEQGIKGSEFGSWPTPTKRDYKDGPSPRYRDGKLQLDTLGRAILNGGNQIQQNYPTPTNSMMTMGDMVQAQFSGSDPKRPKYKDVKNFPTPTVQDFKRRGPNSKQQGLSNIAPKGQGQLNPNWVEWLMGWPKGWTDLKLLETDKFQQWQQSHSLFYQKD